MALLPAIGVSPDWMVNDLASAFVSGTEQSDPAAAETARLISEAILEVLTGFTLLGFAVAGLYLNFLKLVRWVLRMNMWKSS